MTLLITEEDTTALLDANGAIPVIEEMFRMMGEGKALNAQRLELEVPDGYLLFRAGALIANRRLGFKLLTNLGSGPVLMQNFLYDTATGELLAIVQSRAISGFRTSAATAVAAKHLSSPDASTVGMYGTGRQAAAQLAAVCAVRPIKRARVYSRNADRRESFCRDVAERLGITVDPMESAERVPENADIVLTMTNSETPVLRGDWLTKPCLVIGAGANEWYERELDEKVITKASLIVVDEKEEAKRFGGDLLWPIDHGLLRWDRVVELGEVVAGQVTVPDWNSGVILFESLGIGLEDVAIANAAYELALANGAGRKIEL